MFRGTCLKKIDNEMVRMPSVNLSTLEECVNYTMLHKRVFEEVIIEDNDEYCVLHALDGEIVFPKEFAGR